VTFSTKKAPVVLGRVFRDGLVLARLAARDATWRLGLRAFVGIEESCQLSFGQLIVFGAFSALDDVSICANSAVLPGLIVGAGAIVSAASVVASDVAENTSAAGEPARFLRVR